MFAIFALHILRIMTAMVTKYSLKNILEGKHLINKWIKHFLKYCAGLFCKHSANKKAALRSCAC